MIVVKVNRKDSDVLRDIHMGDPFKIINEDGKEVYYIRVNDMLDGSFRALNLQTFGLEAFPSINLPATKVKGTIIIED